MKKKDACLLYHTDDRGSIESHCSKEPYPDKDKVLHYLLSGELYGQTKGWRPYATSDINLIRLERLEDGTRVQGNTISEWETISIWTDGEWIWDNILLNYVEFKNFKIDDSFLQHMKNNQWQVPELDLDDPKLYE